MDNHRNIKILGGKLVGKEDEITGNKEFRLIRSVIVPKDMVAAYLRRDYEMAAMDSIRLKDTNEEITEII